MTYVAVKDLPPAMQSALLSVGYGRKDIEVKASETVSIACSGGDGYRGFAIILNLATGEREAHYGSWGGANMFNANRVDLDTAEHTIPVNGCVIRGSTGGDRPVYANITVRPDAIAALLPAPSDVTEDEKRVLYAYRALKGGPYRKEYLAKIKDSDALIDSLVSRGFLKRSSNGATQITTEGRNAVGHTNYY